MNMPVGRSPIGQLTRPTAVLVSKATSRYVPGSRSSSDIISNLPTGTHDRTPPAGHRRLNGQSDKDDRNRAPDYVLDRRHSDARAAVERVTKRAPQRPSWRVPDRRPGRCGSGLGSDAERPPQPSGGDDYTR